MVRMTKIFFALPLVLSGVLSNHCGFAQGNLHGRSSEYMWPDDPLVLRQLEKWQDRKFGMIIHWGVYAVPGIIESWALCSEDWIERDSTVSYEDFKSWYWGQSRAFNPRGFDPEQWASAAAEAGMRYVVFTTKHHDGFSMFDTRHSDYKITTGPFGDHEKANVALHVFDAFRKKGFMIGAYFSKPDWHSEYYWWPKYATPDRNNNYDVRKHPWRWNMFRQFTHAQIEELMTNYGAVDILWLDGGWVRPLETVNDEVRSWGAAIPEWSQDIGMPEIAAMARKKQPGLLIVDRTVHGPYENYQTPEQRVPSSKLDHPWESCITLGNAWGYVPNDIFKSAETIIHTLVEITAKGGSMLLGVGPDADGRLRDEQVSRLRDIGRWLHRNGDAIYNTRPAEVTQTGAVFYTRSKDRKKHYAILLVTNPEKVPVSVDFDAAAFSQCRSVRLLETRQALKWRKTGSAIRVAIPSQVIRDQKNSPAIVFVIE
jgi:alpha-L-fucosidase